MNYASGTPATAPTQHNQAHLIGELIRATLLAKKIDAIVALAWDGPQLWAYSVSLPFGKSPRQIEGLADALALAAGADSCRISRSEGKLYIEIPKPEAQRQTLNGVALAQLKPPTLTAVAVGVSTFGRAAWLDIADERTCHVVIGGVTGSGKSVLLHWMLYRLAAQNSRQDLRLLLIDPKGTELRPFAQSQHLLHPIVSKPIDAARVLAWVSAEIDRRMATGASQPRLVVCVDEVRDLIASSPDVEALIARIVHIGRASGINLIASTQQPGADALGEGLPNFPARLIGRVATATLTYGATGRSKTMADQLLGRGDFLLLTAGAATRIQVPWVRPSLIGTLPQVHQVPTLDAELPAVVAFADRARDPRGGAGRRDLAGEDLAQIDAALAGGATIGGLRERFNIGHSRATRLYNAYWGTDGEQHP